MGPCMCGDTNCPSCGPLLGANPDFELVCEWLENDLLASMPEAVNLSWLAEDLASRINRTGSQELADAFYNAAKKWAEAERAKRERISERVYKSILENS